MRKRGKSFAVWLYGLMLFWGMGGSARAGELTINGSTTILPFAQVAVERFMASRPEVRISLSGGGTGNGIKALIDGTADIANASRAIRQGEAERARGKGVNPVRFVVALDCIVPIVHPGNPVRSLTLDQLKKIYTGEIVNWKEVGGEDAPIAAVGRDSSSGTYGTWQEMVVERGGRPGQKKPGGGPDPGRRLQRRDGGHGRRQPVRHRIRRHRIRRRHDSGAQRRGGRALRRKRQGGTLSAFSRTLHVHGRGARGGRQELYRLHALSGRAEDRGGRGVHPRKPLGETAKPLRSIKINRFLL